MKRSSLIIALLASLLLGGRAHAQFLPYIGNSGNPIIDAVNSTSPFNLFSQSITGGDLGTMGCLKFESYSSLLYNNSTSDTFTLILSYGGVNVYSGALKPPAVSAGLRGLLVTGSICNAGVTGTQATFVNVQIGGVSSFTSNGAASNGITAVNGATTATDSTATQTLTLSVTWSAASANDEIKTYEAKAWWTT